MNFYAYAPLFSAYFESLGIHLKRERRSYLLMKLLPRQTCSLKTNINSSLSM